MYNRTEVSEFITGLTVYRLVTHQETRERFLTYYSYAFEMSLPCTGCPGELEAGINKLKWLLTRHNETHETLQKATKLMRYQMKPNARIYSYKLMMMVTPLNCTDTIAEALINENPKHLGLFTINEGVTPETKKAKPLTIGNPTLPAAPAEVPVEVLAEVPAAIAPAPKAKRIRKRKK